MTQSPIITVIYSGVTLIWPCVPSLQLSTLIWNLYDFVITVFTMMRYFYLLYITVIYYDVTLIWHCLPPSQSSTIMWHLHDCLRSLQSSTMMWHLYNSMFHNNSHLLWSKWHLYDYIWLSPIITVIYYGVKLIYLYLALLQSSTLVYDRISNHYSNLL